MTITLSTPDLDQLAEVVRVLRDWQRDGSPFQLHPGDLGWFWRFGAEATAAAVRTWRRDGQLLAAGLLDGDDLLRLTVAPPSWHEGELADRVVSDVSDPARGVLPAGTVSIEAPNGSRVQDLLAEAGWNAGEAWTPLRHELLPHELLRHEFSETGTSETTGLRVEVIGPERATDFAAVVRSAFDSTRFTEQRWQAMAGGPAFTDARCLLGYDSDHGSDHGSAPAAVVTVWSAGPGRPGLIEPMGVHAEHRGRGFGRAICLAAATELARLGSSSALVCTRSAKTAAIATYQSAGFQRLAERLDRTRSS